MTIDIQALSGITREAIGSRTFGESAEYGALCRAIGYVLGGDYQAPDWRDLVYAVRQVVTDGTPSDGSSASLGVATPLVVGALLTLARRDVLPVVYTRDADTARIVRESDGYDVESDDDDWLVACGYMRQTEHGTVRV